MIKQSFIISIYSAFLIWLPFFGPLIGGYFGTKKINNFAEAVIISIVPMLLMGLFSIALFQKVTFIQISSIGIVVYLTVQQVGVLAGVVFKGLIKR